MAKNIYGIDLGTSNSAIAYLDSLGVPQIQENSDGDNTTPSVVWFESDSNTVVGKVAKEERFFSPDDVLSLVKRHMGEDKHWDFQGRSYTPESISALILKSLVSLVPTGADATPVVITVPAYFGAKEREATRQAGEIAGLEVLNLIPEPVAAALYYDSLHSLKDKNLLVYDLGGGTFDVTTVQSNGDAFEILATEGDARLGGADWDKTLKELILDKVIDETGRDVLEENTDFLVSLDEETSKCKHALSSAETHTIRLAPDARTKVKVTVTRAEFEEASQLLLERTSHCVQRVLEVTKKKQPDFDVDEVILVGGSSRMAAVAKLVNEITGLEARLFEPDLAVAKGAALSATISQLQKMTEESENPAAKEQAVARLAAETGVDAGKLTTLVDKKVLNVLPRGIGFNVLRQTPNGLEHFVDFLVEQNTTIPLQNKVTREYATLEANQEALNLALYQQATEVASEDPKANEVVTGSEGFSITGLPPSPADSPVQVELFIDGDGKISFTAVHVPSGKSLNAEIKIGVLSSEAVDQARNQLRGMRVSQKED